MSGRVRTEEEQGEEQEGFLVLARRSLWGAAPSLDHHDDGRDKEEDTTPQNGKVEGFLPTSCPSPSRRGGRPAGWSSHYFHLNRFFTDHNLISVPHSSA